MIVGKAAFRRTGHSFRLSAAKRQPIAPRRSPKGPPGVGVVSAPTPELAWGHRPSKTREAPEGSSEASHSGGRLPWRCATGWREGRKQPGRHRRGDLAMIAQGVLAVIGPWAHLLVRPAA
jgi:hypothetical protein